jgi:uncharacterized cupredoxin-like copper-binding protein
VPQSDSNRGRARRVYPGVINATRLPMVVLLAGSLAVAGCGDDNDDSGSTGAAEQSAPAASGGGGETVSLAASEFKFTPSDPAVKKTGKVTFEVKNDGKIDHALEVEGPNGETETDAIASGQSATLTVDLSKAGKYEMYCPIGNHRDEGMEGTVTVAGGGGGAAEDDGGGSDDSGSGGY